MSIVEGVVQKVSQRGKATNILVNEQWYGCGFDGVPCSEGDRVSFPVTQNGRFLNADVKNMQVLGKANVAPQQSSGNYQNTGGGGTSKSAVRSGGRGSYGGGRKLDDPVQVSITQQSARNAAIQALSVAVQADAVPLPAKKADKLDAFLALVDQVTERYYKETWEVAEAGGYTERADKAPIAQGIEKQEDQAPNAEYDDDIPF